jgi:5-methylcytosine-specific restriction endonuclease McrA
MRVASKGSIEVWTDPGKYSMFEILLMHGTKCHICNGSIDYSAPRIVGRKGWQNGLHLDHVIPLSKGGSDHIENVKPSHAKCNISKGADVRKFRTPRYPPVVSTAAWRTARYKNSS